MENHSWGALAGCSTVIFNANVFTVFQREVYSFFIFSMLVIKKVIKGMFFRFKDVYYFYNFHCILLLILYKKHHFLLKKIQFNLPFRTGLLPVYYSLLKKYLSYELTLMCCRTATP
ncbi:hypothetical protein XK86_20430 [Hafnia alvei]|nr:hypothetical protein XK86_20430 [Hafnia alvei]